MSYYSLSKVERAELKIKIEKDIERDLKSRTLEKILLYSSDEDTYIRKNAYLALGKIYKNESELQLSILSALKLLCSHENEKVRQTAVYALGEIGIIEFSAITDMLKLSLEDEHHSVLNAVTGALKQIGQKNPEPAFEFIKANLNHPEPNIKAKLMHGLELRGRTHPEEVMPILEKHQHDKSKKVKDMIIHIIGQISYKEGCLDKVVEHLKNWTNQDLLSKALKEIIHVHHSYSKFSAKHVEEVEYYLKAEFQPFES